MSGHYSKCVPEPEVIYIGTRVTTYKPLLYIWYTAVYLNYVQLHAYQLWGHWKESHDLWGWQRCGLTPCSPLRSLPTASGLHQPTQSAYRLRSLPQIFVWTQWLDDWTGIYGRIAKTRGRYGRGWSLETSSCGRNTIRQFNIFSVLRIHTRFWWQSLTGRDNFGE
jgi:hypothetical protein